MGPSETDDMSGKVSEETRRALTKMFLPELHQARWAERLAQLQEQQDATTDPAKVQAIEEQIIEHYTHQYDVEQTRGEVLGDEPEQ